ncbi:hypothetical protein [Fredinandcohnia sp. 179-A 10B2 NHS]|uniref:hypothetical protein n=1 Tax=Fredinandcohnia sp. 179-A 10B2 NHS TaxID=3235176 RepID=UPI0039A3073B
MATTILLFIFSIPFYGLLIWTYLCPEDSLLWGNRWMYQDEPDFSEEAIKYTKYSALIGIGILTLLLVIRVITHF